jgi:hypothetical protein
MEITGESSSVQKFKYLLFLKFVEPKKLILIRKNADERSYKNNLSDIIKDFL